MPALDLPALDLARSRTWATVDLDAVAHNVRALRGRLPAGTAFMAVVKADGYGHGLVPVAEAAAAAGASWLGVATAAEALALHAAGVGAAGVGAAGVGAAGVRVRTLILGPVSPAWLPALAAAGCALTVADLSGLAAVQSLSAEPRPRVHFKVDTGMTRLGVAPDDLPPLLDRVDPSRVEVEGVYTHLACADDPDPATTHGQLAIFDRAARAVRARFPAAMAHAAASAAVLGHPEAALDLVRVGLALYGIVPTPHLGAPPLRPAMTLSSRVVRIRRVPPGTPVSYGATYRTPRETAIATVPVGYGDGYPRSLGNRGQMVIGGRRFPVAGRVCMDYTMLDVGDAPVQEGEEVTVFGQGLPAGEVAAAAGTIPYELLCRVSRRVPRLYLRAGRVVAVTGEEAR